MEIKREKYLNELENMRHTSFVKVLTGMRRCGKSYMLFELFNKHLISQGVDPSRIIKLALDSYSLRELRKPENLYNYLKSKVVDGGMNYIMIDEIQLVDDFADILNEFLRRSDVDIYVTGSNAKLLSKDVITEFRGRGHEIKMYPLSFAEYMSVSKSEKAIALNEYMTYGALPQIFEYQTEQSKIKFLKSLFEETYIRDIKDRYQIRNDDDLEELLDLIASNIACLTNPRKLSDTFKSLKKSNISPDTVKRYLSYFEDSFLIEQAMRYDVKGKRYIDTPHKYYFTDLGLRNARLNFRQIEPTHLMENVIYNELLMRGFNVDVGVVPIRRTDSDGVVRRSQLEIDFVCNQGSKRYYVQSAYSLPSIEKVKQEEASLVNVDDSFKKIIVSGDDCLVHRNDAGITTMSIYDFLLNPDSLDL